MSFRATVLIALLTSVQAQTSITGSGTTQQALTATVGVSDTINTALPQTAALGPQGFTIPYVDTAPPCL